MEASVLHLQVFLSEKRYSLIPGEEEEGEVEEGEVEA